MARKFTTEINDSEYIGDSLTTINTNFNTLDTSCQVISSFFVSGSAGVAQIIAGTNITLSPVNGSGIVTINSTGGGNGVDTEVRALTSNWESTYTTVRDTSSSWSGGGGTNISGISSTETYYYLNASDVRGVPSSYINVFPDTVNFTLSANKIYEINWKVFCSVNHSVSQPKEIWWALSADNNFSQAAFIATIYPYINSLTTQGTQTKGRFGQTNSLVYLPNLTVETNNDLYLDAKATVKTGVETTVCLAVSGSTDDIVRIWEGSTGLAKWIGNA